MSFSTSLGRLGIVTLALVSSTVAARAEDIAIAVAGPMTGPYASFGEQLRRGAELAVEEINAKGGVLGKKLVLQIGDDACDPKQAVAVANQLASSGVVFVDGHFCSSSSIPASAVYAETGVLMITPASTNPKLTDEASDRDWTNIYRVCGRDDQQTIPAIDYLLKNFKGKNIALIHDKTVAGQGLAASVRKALNDGGLKEVFFDSINPGERDFSALITRLSQAKVDAIYFGGYHTEAGLIVRQARERGLDAVLIGPDSLMTEEFWSITGDTGEGTLMSFAPDPRKLPEARGTVEKFKAQGYEPEGYTLYSYASVQVFAEAAKRANSLELPDLTKALHDGASYKTVIGEIAYDGKGDVRNPKYVLYRWSQGKYAPI